MNIVIGIDFGTSNSCISYYDSELKKVVIILDEEHNMIYSSGLEILVNEIVCGERVNLIGIRDLKNYFRYLKRLVGKKYMDLMGDEKLKEFFKDNKIMDINNEIVFDVFGVKYNIYDLIIIYIKYLKSLIVEYFKVKEIFAIVITVPAYFNDIQRVLIKNCFEECEFNVIRIINEPTAAALAYIDIDVKKESEYILVFDCGGGTSDLSLLYMDYENGVYEVKDVIGDNFLGGEDLTILLYNYIIKKLDKLTDRIRNRIKKECERVKRELSYKNNSIILIEIGDEYIKIEISRSLFIEICKSFFMKIEELINFILKNKKEISRVIFVGGTSRIPYFEDIFKRYLGKVIINKEVNPDIAISTGASIQGMMLNMEESKFSEMVLFDVIPLSLGVEIYGGIMDIIIPRNTIIPVSRKKIFTNSVDFEESVIISVYQGERRFVDNNYLLDKFELKHVDMKEYEKETLKIEVEFSIDSDGIITISADISRGDVFSICEVNRINKERIEEIVNKIDISCILMESELLKMVDSYEANKKLLKLELYELFKKLLCIFHEKREKILDGLGENSSFTLSELNKLFERTFNVINDYKKYKVEELKDIKRDFEESWHELLFTIDPIFKDSEGLLVELGGSELTPESG